MAAPRHRSGSEIGRRDHARSVRRIGYSTATQSRSHRGLIMENVILIFLLFFAVLAFGWFYLQRAKRRDTAGAATSTTTATADPSTHTSPDEPAA